MIFDKFCAVVERHMPELIPMMQDAKLFLFDKPAHSIGPGDTSREGMELFSLPFPFTVIEDPASAIFLFDSETDQVGLEGKRAFIEVTPVFGDDSAFNLNLLENPDRLSQYRENMQRNGMTDATVIAVFGIIEKGVPGVGGVEMQYSVNRMVAADKAKLHLNGPPPKSIEERLVKSTAKNVLAAIEELLLINNKKNFVLETIPTKVKVRKDGIPRAHQRPTYSILDARTIRKTMGTSGEHAATLSERSARNSPIPHERRRHLRRLRSGKVVTVKAAWIGTSEKTVGNKVYKVRLDV